MTYGTLPSCATKRSDCLEGSGNKSPGLEAAAAVDGIGGCHEFVPDGKAKNSKALPEEKTNFAKKRSVFQDDLEPSQYSF